jgi:hypothetical protein
MGTEFPKDSRGPSSGRQALAKRTKFFTGLVRDITQRRLSEQGKFSRSATTNSGESESDLHWTIFCQRIGGHSILFVTATQKFADENSAGRASREARGKNWARG